MGNYIVPHSTRRLEKDIYSQGDIRHRVNQEAIMNTRMCLSLIIVLLLLVIPVFGDDLTKIYGSVPKYGVNKVTLDNSQNEKEAVVVFKEINWPIPFAVYVSPKKTGVLSLPSESYQIYYTLGYGWSNAEKRFIKDPEYFMLGNVLNAGEDGTIHEEKTTPVNIVTGTYVDEHNVTRTLTQETGPAEWSWAESRIMLFPDSQNPAISIDESEFPL